MIKILINLSLIITICTTSIAQENASIKFRKKGDTNDIALQIKEGAKPDVYIDGKKYDADIVELLDQDQIATINIIGGDEAIKEYNTGNKVILITTKKQAAKENPSFEINDDNSKIKIKNKTNDKIKPTLIVDGKKWDHDSLKELDPNDIEKIEVVKGDAAIKKYDSPNGVIIVKLKKSKNK